VVQPERIVGIGTKVVKSTSDAIDALVKQGLRASLESASLITGQQMVALDFVADAPPATVTMEGPNFVLPSINGSGLGGLMASATELLTKVDAIPFDQIGDNLNGILKGANTLASGPELKQSLTELAQLVTRVKLLADHLDNGLSPAVKQLPQLASDLQKTLTGATKLVQSLNEGYGSNTQFSRDLQRLLVQVNEAATSVRALADLLSRDPGALIAGRPTGGTQ
jgi:paraquat-inducible protein B